VGPHWVPWACRLQDASVESVQSSGQLWVPVGTLIALAGEWDDVVAVQRVQQAVGALKI
jgi:hypothetical protein